MKLNDKIGVLLCKHSFHKSCLVEWLIKKANCPLCRENCKKFTDVPFL